MAKRKHIHGHRCTQPSATTDPLVGISSPPLGHIHRLGPRDGRGSWIGRHRCPKLSLLKNGQWWSPLGSGSVMWPISSSCFSQAGQAEAVEQQCSQPTRGKDKGLRHYSQVGTTVPLLIPSFTKRDILRSA